MGMEKGTSLLFIDVGQNWPAWLRTGMCQKREENKKTCAGERQEVREGQRRKGKLQGLEVPWTSLSRTSLYGLSEDRPSVLSLSAVC